MEIITYWFAQIVVVTGLLGGALRFVDAVYDVWQWARRKAFLSMLVDELDERGVYATKTSVRKNAMRGVLHHHSIPHPRPFEVPATFLIDQADPSTLAAYLIDVMGIDVNAEAPLPEEGAGHATDAVEKVEA